MDNKVRKNKEEIEQILKYADIISERAKDASIKSAQITNMEKREILKEIEIVEKEGMF